MSKNLPAMAGPAGGLVPFMSARRRHEICDIVFENLGGTQRLEHEANRDQDSFWKFMGLWSKGLPRAVSQQHSADAGVEDLLDRLDKAAKKRKPSTAITEVEDESA
jgi:hypothetical protein